MSQGPRGGRGESRLVLPARAVWADKWTQRGGPHDAEEGRRGIVPGQRRNARGGQAPRHHPPGRGDVVRPAASHGTTAPPLPRRAGRSARAPQKPCQRLRPPFPATSRTECCHPLDGPTAVGADGGRKAAYARPVEANRPDRVARLKRLAARPGPVRHVLLPTAGTPQATRPGGRSPLEETGGQWRMPRGVERLSAPLVLDGSSGVSPGRGGHEARRALPPPLSR
jgi:RNA-directed DNA polymerase